MKISIDIKQAYMAIVALAVTLMAASCGNQTYDKAKTDKADSLINAAYKAHDYGRLIELAEKLDSSGSISAMKADYWLGYAYSRQRKMKLAENYWQKAMNLSINNVEDMEYYAKSANRLSSVLLLRAEYEATMKVALPAMEKMTEAGYDKNDDFAYLLTSVGCCQLKLESPEAAHESFVRAYKTYLYDIERKGNITSFTSAIVGVITITDNYLMQKRFEEARAWTDHFDELLQRYQQLPKPDMAFLDKQQARFYLYRASALEGLGERVEAAKAYDEALKTNYAKTDDGMLEATSYLMSAKRWTEAARNFEDLDAELHKFNLMYTLDNIQRFLLPKYRANLGAHRNDSALAIGQVLCDRLDSAIISSQLSDAAELATLYSTQQKETEIMRQKAKYQRQQFIVVTVVLLIIILSFALVIYYRRQSALRLEIAYHQLELANERAEESSRMKTNFIQQISHEIRTPLNILSGFTQIITTPGMELDGDTKRDINLQILENTNRITSLVNKMLELSDTNSQAVIERKDHVLGIQIAAQAVENTTAGDTNLIPVDMQLGEGAEEAMLLTNEQAATRVLELLLDNAQKYTKEGTIRLIVNASADKLSFLVEDTGIGVPPEEAEHIFDEFVQLDDYNEGTGIGLTVARSISRRLGGDVVLDTSYTGGARFVMTLPTGEE